MAAAVEPAEMPAVQVQPALGSVPAAAVPAAAHLLKIQLVPVVVLQAAQVAHLRVMQAAGQQVAAVAVQVAQALRHLPIVQVSALLGMAVWVYPATFPVRRSSMAAVAVAIIQDMQAV
jgi:hypothetical protein